MCQSCVARATRAAVLARLRPRPGAAVRPAGGSRGFYVRDGARFARATATALLHDAVVTDDAGRARRALAMGADASAPVGCDPPLQVAVKRGGVGLVRLLLRHGVDADARNSAGETALATAVRYGHRGVVRLLLHHGAGANVPDRRGRTPLHLAAGHDGTARSQMVRILLEAGAAVTAVDSDGLTPLAHAARAGLAGPARLLLARGADAGARDNEGMTPIHIAALFDRSIELVECLVGAGADLFAKDDQGWTALSHAVSAASMPLVEYFLAKGVVDHRALGVAAGQRATFLLNVLFKHGASIAETEKLGYKLLHIAAEANNDATIDVLLAHGADLLGVTASGSTALHSAAARCNLDASRCLIARGLGVGLRTNFGETALHAVAGRNAPVPCARLLLERGADANAIDNAGMTPLHTELAHGSSDGLVALLLDAGADVGVADADGATPLAIALERGRTAAAALLVARGADPARLDARLRAAARAMAAPAAPRERRARPADADCVVAREPPAPGDTYRRCAAAGHTVGALYAVGEFEHTCPLCFAPLEPVDYVNE